jgi:hypothetical protein
MDHRFQGHVIITESVGHEASVSEATASSHPHKADDQHVGFSSENIST